MSLKSYIVSIDDEKHDIHAITVIYASEHEQARAIVKSDVPDAIVKVYDRFFPNFLLEGGEIYILSAWKLLQPMFNVAKQKDKILDLENELANAKKKLAALEKVVENTREEERAIPQF